MINKRFFLFAAALAAIAVIVVTCEREEAITGSDESAPLHSTISLSKVLADYGVILYAGQTINAGMVNVTADGDTIYITYQTTGDWELLQTHLWIGENLAAMPQTRTGNPQVGQFPYHGGPFPKGTTTYNISIAVADLGGEPYICDRTFYIAAHAVVGEPDSWGGYLHTETGWAAGARFVSKGSWATYFNVVFTCEDDGGVEPMICETAFAFGGTCFLNIDENGDGRGDFNRWGWTIGPLSPGTYSYPIYAAAGQCDITKGTLVGDLSVSYSGGTATVTYQMDNPYVMDETHAFVGNEILPRDSKGKYTVAPGQFTSIHEHEGYLTTDSYTFTGLSGTIYVIAHAVVCGFDE